MKKTLGILIIALGIISGVMFFKAGLSLYSEGKELTSLRSVGGTSIAENYYQSIGKYGIAYGTISFAFGLGVISISLGLGGRMLLENSELTNKTVNQNKILDVPNLISCPNCNNPCSAQAVACPKCGANLKNLS